MKVSADSNKRDMKTAGFAESFILGVGIAGGGLATSLWQQILTGGMWEGLISLIVIAVGYILLDSSLSELVSIVPFAGGSFGYVRCSMGPFYGFMTGCSEMILYMFYTISTVLKISTSFTRIFLTDQSYEPLWGLLTYALVAAVHVQGVNVFWRVMLGCTIFTFILIAVYIIGSLTVVDINHYALNYTSSKGSSGIFDNIYSAMWLYMGICALPLTSACVKNESETIPKAMMSAITLMVAISIIVLFCVACQAPGIGPHLLFDVDYVLQYGLQNIFHVPKRIVPLLLLIPTFASTVGFMFACKHQLSAMAESGLMPSILKKKVGINEIPIYSVLGCCVFQFVLFIVQLYRGRGVQSTFRIAVMAGCVMYVFILGAFITFRYRYASMERSFVSWPGVPGAIFGILIFLFVLLILMTFQTSGQNSALTASFWSFMLAMVVYYFGYVQYVQYFSKEEQGKFMKAYITNANKKKKQSKYYRYILSFANYLTCGYLLKRSNSKRGLASAHSGSTDNNGKRSQSTHASSEQSGSHSYGFTVSQLGSVFPRRKVDIEPVAAAASTNPSNATTSPPLPAEVVSLKVTTRNNILRTSFNNNNNKPGGSIELNWSGKYFNDANESRKAFAILTRAAEEDEDEVESSNNNATATTVNGLNNEGNLNTVVDLLTEFPAHFDMPGFVSVTADLEQGQMTAPAVLVSSNDQQESIRGAEAT